MKRLFIVTTFLLLQAGIHNSQAALNMTVRGDTIINTLSEYFFGHNYWMWCPSWGNQIEGTEAQVSDLKLDLLRFGGISVDLGYPDAVSNSVLQDYADYCKTVNAEPLLQLQLAKYTNTEDRVSNAAAMFTYFKSISPVKFVSIGNEPDIYPDNLGVNASYGAEYLQSYTLDDYCNDFNAVATEIKRLDPNVKIVGLELSHKYNEWIPEFVSRCKDNVDIISLHYYPNAASGCSYNTARGQDIYMRSFYLNARVLINQNAGDKVIPLIIGETNITWDGDPAHSTYSASPGTFNAALWFAEFVGISSAQKNLLSIMPWSLREGWTLGFLDESSKPKPVFHVYKMFTNNAKKHLIHRQSLNSYVKVLGYKDDSGNVSIFTMNWDTTSSYELTMNFSGLFSDSSFSCTVPPQSFSCFNFPANSPEPEITVYSKGMSLPTSVIFTPGSQKSAPKLIQTTFNRKASSIEIFSQNPIQNVGAAVFNLQGRIIYETKIGTLKKGLTTLQLKKSLISSGVHILRIYSNSQVITEYKLNK